MKPSHSSFSFREIILSPLLSLALIISVVVFYYADFIYIFHIEDKDDYPTNRTVSTVVKMRGELPFAIGKGNKGCNLYNGSWVRDYYNRPLYEEWECPYVEPQFTCLAHGRPDTGFRHWRWQPHGCSLPSFNATLILEAIRGKRMLFVGDSLNRGQYTSMVCLLQKGIPEHAKSMERIGSLTIFTAKDYDARIEFYWAPFLLESNSDHPFHHRAQNTIVRNGSIDKHGDHWKGADILVFNTYIWWITGLRILRGSFEDKVQDIVEMPVEDAYRMAIKTLKEWVVKNTDPMKTRTFFTSMSPTHQWSYKWQGDPKGNCYNQTTMLQDLSFFAAERSLMEILTEEFTRSPVTFLNITELTSCRVDAHTSIYKEQRGTLSPEKQADPKSYADCIHWCLPGVQDTWNELLYSMILYP